MAGAQSRVRVLHVDDEPGYGDLVRANLDRLGGFETHVERDAAAGLAYLERHPVDCVVSDYQMPEMDGLEFLEAVRDRYGDLPFVLFTGKGSEEIASDAIAAGVTDYLQKATASEHYEVLAHRVRRAVAHHEAERRLTASELRYRTVVEESGLSVVIYGAEGLRFVNQAACALTGYRESELLSMDLRTLVHPEDRALVEGHVAARFDGRDVPDRYEARLLDATDEVLEVEVTARVLQVGDDPTVLAIARDLTAERRQARELASRERQYRTLAENIPDGGVALVDREMTYSLAAGGVFELVDLDVDDVTGRSLAEVHSPAFLETFGPEFDAAFDGERRNYEFSYEDREFEARLVPIYEGSDVTQVMVLTLDTTEANRRSRELERQNERLERFASTVSHDLRNPLAIARGNLDVLEDTLGGPRAASRAIRDALDRADEIVEAVLTLAREGGGTLDQTPLSLSDAAREAWRTVATGSARLDVAPDTPRVVADLRALRTLLENCFRNAVEHGSTSPGSHARQDDDEPGSTSPASGTRPDAPLTVSVGPLSGGDGFVIEDDGVGVPEADRERVLEYGVSDGDGLGLGLAIVTEVARNHGWTARVGEREGGGFRLAFEGVDCVDTDSSGPSTTN